eukprot:959988_1
MAHFKPLSFVLLTLSLSILHELISAKTLTNPTTGGIHHCGLATECTLICNEMFGCQRSVFHVYNSTVSIQCIYSHACDDITVIAHNVEQLNINVHDYLALEHSKIIVDSTNIDPTIDPTFSPTDSPTDAPSDAPTLAPTSSPTAAPSTDPAKAPSNAPTHAPTIVPTPAPTSMPTSAPTMRPISEARVKEEFETTTAVVVSNSVHVNGDGSLTNIDSFVVHNA